MRENCLAGMKGFLVRLEIYIPGRGFFMRNRSSEKGRGNFTEMKPHYREPLQILLGKREKLS